MLRESQERASQYNCTGLSNSRYVRDFGYLHGIGREPVNLMTLMLFMKIASLQATMVGEKPGATRRDHHLHPVLLQIRSPAAPIPRRCKLHNRCNQCSHSSCHRRSIRHSHPEEQQQTVTNAAVNCSQCKEIVCGNCHKRRVATLL